MEQNTPSNGLGVRIGDQPLAARIQSTTASAHSAIDGMSEAARPAVERLAVQAHAVVDRVADAAMGTSAQIGRKGDDLLEAGSRLSANYRRHVGEHPLASVGIAMAAGFVIGRLIRGR